jgi:uncharacterized lipoprotein
MNYRRSTFPAILLAMILAIGACALSPQAIRIRPSLDGGAFAGTQAPAAVALQVADARRDPVIGYRGGVYDTATITAEPALTSAVRTALAAALTRRGLTILDAGGRGDMTLNVEITELRYAIERDKLKYTIETVAAVRAVSSAGNITRTGEYRDRRTKEVLKAPGTEENEELINAVLAGALQRLVEDPELLDY